MKRLLLCISAGVLAALILIQLYNFFVHPEISFYKRADAITTQHEQKLRAAGHSCYIIAGGSEAKSCLIPSVMQEEAGIVVVNTATAAGCGLVSNAAIGMNHIQPGDTLVLSFISCYEEDIHTTDIGMQLAFHLFGTNAFQHGIIPLEPGNLSALLASNASSMLVSAVRKLTRGYSYVYNKESTLHPDGWMEVHRSTMQNAKLRKTIARDIIIGPECRELLLRTQQACRQTKADFVVMIPVGLSNYYEIKRRLMHALQITRMGIPVLKDDRLGLTVNNKILADTYYHMNAEGAEWNSRIVARLLKGKNYWTEQEILAKMKELGFTEDATPQQPSTAI